MEILERSPTLIRNTSSRPDRSGTRTVPAEPTDHKTESMSIYLILGILFGIILIKSEVASWYRIQEMFRFQSFHVYGFMGSALLVAMISLHVIRRFGITTIRKETISLAPKQWDKGYRYWIGGILFGLGWALLSLCPGPLFALLGSGSSILIVALLSALLGTRTYAYLRPKLPH